MIRFGKYVHPVKRFLASLGKSRMEHEVIFTDNSPFRMRGELSVMALKRDGSVLDGFEDRNMWMSISRSIIAQLLGGDVTSKSVAMIAIGNNGLGPTPVDTKIGNITTTSLGSGMNGALAAYLKSVDSHSYPEAGSVKFHWTLGYAEGNGMDIREYGLLCADKVMFAKKTRGVIAKDSSLAVTGEWTLKI